MKIIDNFTLISGAPNILNLSKEQIQSATLEGNSPKHLYITLELKKNMIRHKGLETILNYAKNIDKTKDLDILVLEQYPLVASYNQKTHSKIINIAPFNTKEIGRVSYGNLYGALLYAYTFDKIVNKKLRIPDNMTQPISHFLFSFFVQVFGRDYGMTGTYSSKLPGLKFLLTLYVLVAFFGRIQNKSIYTLSKQFSGYAYEDKIDILKKMDMSTFRGLATSLREMDIMPGFNVIKFTTKMQVMFDLQMLPAFEDLSRFLSLIMVSGYGAQNFSKSYIHKYNKTVYIQILNYMEKRLF